ncbi:MAG: acetylornithine deacetylase [Pseudomonadota bacterium]
MSLPSLHQCMQALIAAPSVSSVNAHWDMGNGEVVELLSNWLPDLGFKVETLEIPGCPDKYNLVASLGQGPGGLVLSGHTDTVPYDEGCWTGDPFTLTERDQRLYGLGTSDMKGFFAVVIEALRDFDLSQLKQPLLILATADEESTMCGAKALHEARVPLGRHAVIGEPTGLRPVRMHKGIAMEAVTVTGRSGHSSDPSLGANALEGMHEVIGEILAWRGELQASHHNARFKVPVPTLNLGHIHGGDNPNRICPECELHFDIRPLPGMGLEQLRADLRGRLERRLEDTGLAMEMKSLFGGVPAMETPATAAIVKACEELTGHASEAVAFATEGPYLNDMGMETVILGPGDIDQAHQPDEYLALDRIPPAIEIIRSLVRQFCL